MLLDSTIGRARAAYNDYPRQFWILVLGSFVDRLGETLLYPFLTLYVTRRFDVGMTEVGVLFGLMSVAGMVGGTLGGALTDQLGRKGMLIYGLVLSGLSSVVLGLVGAFELFFGAMLLVGLLASIGWPARNAMVADLLPEEKRAQGFGILRVAGNLAWVAGPAIGGLLATRSYFICDAVASLITAGIVLVGMQETKPAPRDDESPETMGQTFTGYFRVLRDRAFALLIGASILMAYVYIQMYNVLAVYLRDSHGVSERLFALMISLNATMVVLFQFPLSRRVAKVRPLTLIAVGTVLYAVGFGMYGFVSVYPLFLVAMAVITMGEMLALPTSQALATQFAPEAMRGRYLAVFSFGSRIPAAVGPVLAGLVLDNADPRWLWRTDLVVGLVAAAAYALLQRWIREHNTEREQSLEAPGPA